MIGGIIQSHVRSGMGLGLGSSYLNLNQLSWNTLTYLNHIQDWIPVSESDEDDPTLKGPDNPCDAVCPDQSALDDMITPRNPRASLSVNFPQQSYLFTKSGTIFVDGFMEGKQ